MRTLLLLAILTATANAGPSEDVGKVVTDELTLTSADAFDPDGVIVAESGIMPPGMFGPLLVGMDSSPVDPKETDRQIVIAADGKSAWVSEGLAVSAMHDNRTTTLKTWRISQVLAKTPAGWRVIVASLSAPVANGKANTDAKTGKIKNPILESDKPSDPGLITAFTKLATEGLDASAATRKDLVVIGSGPGERTVGGAGFAKAWATSWIKHLTVTATFAATAPSKTTGWVAATVELAKGSGKTGYKMPFVVFCVFDKTLGGDWSLVHVQFTVRD